MTFLNTAACMHLRRAVFIDDLHGLANVSLAARTHVRFKHLTIHLAGALKKLRLDFMLGLIHCCLREHPLFRFGKFPSRFEVEERQRWARGIKRESGTLHATSCVWVPRDIAAKRSYPGG